MRINNRKKKILHLRDDSQTSGTSLLEAVGLPRGDGHKEGPIKTENESSARDSLQFRPLMENPIRVKVWNFQPGLKYGRTRGSVPAPADRKPLSVRS